VKEDLNLVANGRFQCLVANGRKRKRKKRSTFSPLPIFSQQILLKLSFFSIDLKVLFYHGSRPLLTHFLFFSLTYKLQSRISWRNIFVMKISNCEKCAFILKLIPLQAWYYHISPNSHTFVILLEINFASGDEFKTVCEGC